jgi:hypothetical protein
MHEAILAASRVPLIRRHRYFTSAKTPVPIGYVSKAVETALVQLTLRPAVFVIHPDRQAGLPTEDPRHDTVTLVTESGDVVVDLSQHAQESEPGVFDRAPDDELSQLIFTARDFRRQPYADNCRLAWLCRDYRADPRDRDRILRSLSRKRERTLTEAASECRYSTDPISAVLSLVCGDFAEAELNESPIGPKTRISARRRKGDFA